jgi:hypothetical protein
LKTLKILQYQTGPMLPMNCMRKTCPHLVFEVGVYTLQELDKMRNIFRTELWPLLRGILFPERCLGCGSGVKGLQDISFCQVCLQDVRFIQEPFCTTCGKPFDKSAGKSHLCSYCLKNK